jgi:hypothetical protein
VKIIFANNVKIEQHYQILDIVNHVLIIVKNVFIEIIQQDVIRINVMMVIIQIISDAINVEKVVNPVILLII